MPPYLGLRIPLDERSPPPVPAKFKGKILGAEESAMSAPPLQAPWLNTSDSLDTATKEQERIPERIDIEIRLARTKSIGLPRNPRPGQPIPARKWSANDDHIPPVPTSSRATSRSTVERGRSQREPRRKLLSGRDEEGQPRRRPSIRDGEEQLRRRPSTRDGEEERVRRRPSTRDGEEERVRRRPSTRGGGEERVRRRPSTRDGEEEPRRRRPGTRGSDQSSSRRKDSSAEGLGRIRSHSKLRQLSYPDEDSERLMFNSSSVKKAGLTLKTELSSNDDSPHTPGSDFSPKGELSRSPPEESVWLAFSTTIEKHGDLPAPLRLSKSINGDIKGGDGTEASKPDPPRRPETSSQDSQHQHTDSDATISASHTSGWSSNSSVSSASSVSAASTQPLLAHLLDLSTTATKLVSATNSPFMLPSDTKPMSDENQSIANKALRKYMLQERDYLCAEMRFLGLLLANVALLKQAKKSGGVGASLSGKVVDFLMKRICAVGARLEVVDGISDNLHTASSNNDVEDDEEEISDSDGAGVKMFQSLLEAIGREIEGGKKSVLVGLVIIWTREKVC